MIPFVIEHSNPSDDIKERNIDTHYYSSEKDKLNENIINRLIEIMYEFCSDIYGIGMKIISYDDFCYQYWKKMEIKMENFYGIRVYNGALAELYTRFPERKRRKSSELRSSVFQANNFTNVPLSDCILH